MIVREVVECPECGSRRVWKDGSDVPVPEEFSGISVETVNVAFQEEKPRNTQTPFFALRICSKIVLAVKSPI